MSITFNFQSCLVKYQYCSRMVFYFENHTYTLWPFCDSYFVFAATITPSDAKMATAWNSPDFQGLRRDMARNFDAVSLRSECESRGLITNFQKQEIAAKPTSFAQNDALLDIVQRGDDRSFSIFLTCIRKTQPVANSHAILQTLERMDISTWSSCCSWLVLADSVNSVQLILTFFFLSWTD